MLDTKVVSVISLVKTYGEMIALNGISFDVYKGEVFGLMGPNGAGKTTTLECIEGIRKASSGDIFVVDCDPLKDEGRLRGLLGVQLQSSSLPDNITVYEAMSLICAWHKLPVREDLLNRFGFNDMTKKQYYSLSTGQKRRLHLALALATDPKVVILDEPTAGLDVQGRAQLHDAIRELKEAGVTILIATHDMAEAETLCDRIAILIKGNITTLGTPAQITAAGNIETRITLRTQKNSLLPGKDINKARFLRESEDFGIWMCTDTAQSVMDLLTLVQQNNDTVEDLRVERPSLEERFIELIEGSKLS